MPSASPTAQPSGGVDLDRESRQTLDELDDALKELEEALKEAEDMLNDIDGLE